MNDKFDELARALAQPLTRRAAVKRFGLGLAAFALATLGLTNKAEAGSGGKVKKPLPSYGEPCIYVHKEWLCQPGLVCRYSSLTGWRHICLH